MTDTIDKMKPQNILAAMKGYYTPPKPGPMVVEGKELVKLLQTLSAMSNDPNVDPILVKLEKHHRSVSFDPVERSVLAFVDDAITQVLRQTDLDFRIESFVRDLAPWLAIIALQKGPKATTEPQPLLTLIDLLIRHCIGWSEDLGILGEQYMEKIENLMLDLVKGRATLEETHEALTRYFEKEKPIFDTMEQRLVDSEMAVLVGEKAKFYAAELLNEKMAGQPLPLFIIFMLQGTWYAFLQSIFLSHGPKSKEWQQAGKLTEALIWALQAQKDSARQKALMESIPGQLTTFCERMEFDTAQVEACLGDIEAEFDKIREGEPSDPCDFDLLDTDSSMADSKNIDPQVLASVRKFEEGQWFLYDDKQESDEKVARIILILNWRDTERMLFTNHNRRKVLHMSYAELAKYISDETVRTLTPKSECRQIIRHQLLAVIQGIQQQVKKEIEIEEPVVRKKVSQEFLVQRKAEIEEDLEEHRKISAEKEKRAKVLREKASKKLEVASEAVKGLKVDAMVSLPIMEGTLTPCRLVAIIPGSDKYIFANKAGAKVAEYTGSQLSHLMVTENSAILDTGAEFQSVLASVVTGLREDKNKSYEELTGDTA